MLKIKRLLPVAVLLLAGAVHVPAALASSTQEAMIQDDGQLKANPTGTLATFRALGIDRIRVSLTWSTIAPSARSSHRPRGFNAANPGSYPAVSWAPYDTIARDAQADGIALDFTLTSPAPDWAEGRGEPRGGVVGAWKPSPSEFGAFVRAAATRYDGSYKPKRASGPLPRVSFWSIWNEPNYGRSLAPQASGNDVVELSAVEYRSLVGAAWSALKATGHTPGRDTILIGETAPRGYDHPIGNFGGIKPLRFLRALYCVDSGYRDLRGSAAAARGCPTTASGSRRFRAQNPGLFQASGFADHPYALQAHPGPPNLPTSTTPGQRSDPDYADLPEIPRLEAVLDRLNRTYGSGNRLPIWDTEYGYRTIPPDHAGVSQATAAYFMNWAEYLSWRQPRVRSYMQYLLVDPPGGLFASGLESPGGRPKATLDAFRLPLYLPVTSTKPGRTLEVWGDVRPAHFAPAGQRVQIQFRPGSGGAFTTVQSVAITNSRGYFDAHVAFPGSGAVRLFWSYPDSPATGQLVLSRTVSITVR